MVGAIRSSTIDTGNRDHWIERGRPLEVMGANSPCSLGRQKWGQLPTPLPRPSPRPAVSPTAPLAFDSMSSDARTAYEQYCEAIYELHEDDLDVIQARIADRLGISRPAVSEMMRSLVADGLVTTEGGIRLTDAGMDLAQRVVRRHRLAERFLTDILGLSWAEAHEEASRWEHVVTDRVEAAMWSVLDNPTTCPHGNPIPGSAYVQPNLVPLSALAVGTRFTVTRIPEELEFRAGALDFLEAHEIVPGAPGQVAATAPSGDVQAHIGDHDVDIDAYVGARVLVVVN